MAKTNSLPLTQTIRNPVQSIVNADSFIAANGGTAPTNTKLLCTSGADGSLLKSLTIASDDSGAKQVSIYLSMDAGTTKYLIGTVNVAAGAGLTSGTTVNVDVLANQYLVGLTYDQAGRPILPMQATTGGVTCSIYVGVITSAVTSGRTVHITGVLEDF